MKKIFWFFALLIGVFATANAAQLESRQVLAVTIFSSFILGTLLFWQFRLAFALIGITCLLAAHLMDVPHLIEFANVDIILFLVAMMIVIGFLEERKFFEVLLEKLLAVVSHRVNLLFPAMLALSFISAALVDEVTSILFMTALTLQLVRRLKLPPFPYIIMVVFATNIGSSATVVGNPVGVLIALRAGLSFTDFLRWATPIALVGWVVALGLCYIFFRNPLKQLVEGLRKARSETIHVEQHNKKAFQQGGLIFALTIFGLIFHHQTEHMLHLPKNTMLLGVPLAMAGVCLLICKEKARALVEHRVDWWTLMFFLLLFASVGTLQYVGVTDRIAQGLVAISGSDQTLLLGVVISITALLTAFLDNVLAVAIFVPVVADLATAGADIAPLWWGLLFAGTFGGNATMIGSTANIVAIGMLEKEKEKISFARWLAPGLFITLPTLILAFILLVLQLPLFK
jgi:Na+/H+ antiporter NhaD/arsenite permease-like protein